MDWESLVPVNLGDYGDYEAGRPYFSCSRLLVTPEGLKRILAIAADSAVKPTVETRWSREWDRGDPPGGVGEWVSPVIPAHEMPLVQRHLWTHAADGYLSTLDILRRLGDMWTQAAWSAVVVLPVNPAREWYMDFYVYQWGPGTGPRMLLNGGAVYREDDRADPVKPLGWSLHT